MVRAQGDSCRVEPYPLSRKSDNARATPFDLEHLSITARENRRPFRSCVYEKAKADGVALEKLGTERALAQSQADLAG